MKTSQKSKVILSLFLGLFALAIIAMLANVLINSTFKVVSLTPTNRYLLNAPTENDLNNGKKPGSIYIDNLEFLSKTYDGSRIDNPLPSYSGTGAVYFEYKRQGDSTFTEYMPIDAGTWIIRATVAEDDNYYQAVIEETIVILPKDITGAQVEMDSSALTYNGKEQTKQVTSVIIDDFMVDFTLSGNKQTDVGDDYVLTITGVGNFTGSITKQWSIEKKDISNATVQLGSEVVYNGLEQTQNVESVTVDGLPVTYTVLGNTGTNASNYTMTITANGNFTGSVTKEWNIKKKDISNATVQLGSEVVYNGLEQTQNVESVTVDGLPVTYTVSGNTGTNASNYTMTITANGNFTGSVTKEWNIAQKNSPNPTPENDKFNYLPLVVTIAVIVVGAIAVLVIIKKKKSAN